MWEFSVIIEKDEDGYFVASVPSLRGCHTQVKFLDNLIKRIKEAIELCLEVEKPTPNEFVGVQKVAVHGCPLSWNRNHRTRASCSNFARLRYHKRRTQKETLSEQPHEYGLANPLCFFASRLYGALPR